MSTATTNRRNRRGSPDAIDALIDAIDQRFRAAAAELRDGDAQRRVVDLLEQLVEIAASRSPIDGERPRLLGRVKAAAYLGISPRSVDYLRKSGKLRAVVIESRPLFDRGDLDEFIERSRNG